MRPLPLSGDLLDVARHADADIAKQKAGKIAETLLGIHHAIGSRMSPADIGPRGECRAYRHRGIRPVDIRIVDFDETVAELTDQSPGKAGRHEVVGRSGPREPKGVAYAEPAIQRVC